MNFERGTIWRDPSYRFYHALMVDTLVPIRLRRWVIRITTLLIVFHLIASFGPYMLEKLSNESPHQIVTMSGTFVTESSAPIRLPQFLPLVGGLPIPLSPTLPRMNGVFLLVLIVWLLTKSLSWFRNSSYFYVEGLLERGKTGAQTAYTTPNYEVCAILWNTQYGDLLASFARSPYGKLLLMRCGIATETAEEYLEKRTAVVDFSRLDTELREVYTLNSLAKFLLDKDPDFYQFLFELGIREREFVGAAEWIERDIKRQKQNSRWWGKVKLGQSTTIGAEFAYGGAYILGRYSTDLTKQAISGGSNFRFVYGNEEITQLEVVLSRSKEANAIFVGEEGAGKMDVLLDFARDIMNGYAHPSLRHKRVMVFHVHTFLSTIRSKQELESQLIKIFNDAVRSGNIILVIEDLPGFIEAGHALDSDVMALLDPYFASAALQVIATADNTRFHQLVETNSAIMNRFEKVMLSEPGEESLIRILEETAESMERRNPIYFTYPAVVEIIRCAQRYFSDGVMPDKAIDLLVELTPSMLSRGGHLVKKLDVLEFVHKKTNIPVGSISDEERAKLEHLEDELKKLVTGQDKALEVIANAMRRSRAGVRNENRPIGAFLFLGPTGVGKTETAKALATVFFGNESAMSRLDMSEYQSEDGLARLIGGMDGELGALPVLLKEHPYGVLLLDEFEKTNLKVLDLFLQVFDEGIFHDAQGKKVNARNTIFIATSNAGAAQIREAIKSGIDLDAVQKEVIDAIIAKGTLKPELLNRFDGIVLFHPLGEEQYRQIAELMLKKLQKRLREKSINLVINSTLIEAVMNQGVDPDFGARPMARAVQDVVEQKVAQKIIAGQLSEGSRLEFTPEDFS